jgi:NAD(P)-dependent dehydrogenase (short-subunit alcohol dehydrogenase family)
MADKPLSGKVAIITGGSRGLGREMACAYAAAGAAGIAITAAPGADEDRDGIDAELNAVIADIEKAGGKGLAIIADVADAADCQRTVDETLKAFGALHILVNNAGKSGRYVHGGNTTLSISDVDPAGLRDVIETNVLGPFLMANAVTGHLLDGEWGRIINISKRADSMHKKSITPYGPSKAALDAATIAWAEAMMDTGVTVNSLSPGGAVNTRFGTGKIQNRGLDPAVIGPISVWLASNASDGITGCRYAADRWDTALGVQGPDQAMAAAEGSRERAIFPVPERPTPLDRAWKDPKVARA